MCVPVLMYTEYCRRIVGMQEFRDVANPDGRTDRQTETDRDRQRQTETDRDTDRQTNREPASQPGRQAGRQTDRESRARTGSPACWVPWRAAAPVLVRLRTTILAGVKVRALS